MQVPTQSRLISAKLLPVLWLMILFVVDVAASGKPVINICQIPWNDGKARRTALLAHSKFSTEFYADKFPELQFNWTLLNKDRNTNPSDVVFSVLTAPVDCDAYVGPPTSPTSVSVSPLIKKFWISESASSTQLSNKLAHPTFSRMIATDDVTGQAMAASLVSLGIKSGAFIGSDDAYGRSVAGGFAVHFALAGGSVGLQQFLLSDYNATVSALAYVREHTSTKLIVVATQYTGILVAAAKHLGMDKTHMFFFSENVCIKGHETLLALPSAWCVQYTPEAKTVQTHMEAFGLEPRAKVHDFFVDTHGLVSYDTTYTDQFVFLAVDAVTMLMHGYQALWEASGKNETLMRLNQTSETAFQLLRNVTFRGVTGQVAMDPSGDRLGSSVALFNVNSTGGHNRMATWDAFQGLTMLKNHTPYWFDSYYAEDTPASLLPPPLDAGLPTDLIIGVTIGVVVLLMIVLLVYKLRTASKELVKQLAKSGSFIFIVQLVAQFLDLCTDILGCYTVVKRSGWGMLPVFYTVLTSVATFASIAEIQLMVRVFMATVDNGGRLVADERAEWDIASAKISTFSLIAEDIPMIIISSVALYEEPDPVLLISLVVSALFLGAKGRRIPEVVDAYIDRLVDEEHLAEEAAVGRLGDISSPTKNDSNGGFDLCAMSIAKFDVNPTSSTEDDLDRVLKHIEIKYPKRFEVLQSLVEDANEMFSRRRLNPSEYFAVVSRGMDEFFLKRNAALRQGGSMLHSRSAAEMLESRQQLRNTELFPSSMSQNPLTKQQSAVNQSEKQLEVESVESSCIALEDPHTATASGRAPSDATTIPRALSPTEWEEA